MKLSDIALFIMFGCWVDVISIKGQQLVKVNFSVDYCCVQELPGHCWFTDIPMPPYLYIMYTVKKHMRLSLFLVVRKYAPIR